MIVTKTSRSRNLENLLLGRYSLIERLSFIALAMFGGSGVDLTLAENLTRTFLGAGSEWEESA
jgi:hypothetical protein